MLNPDDRTVKVAEPARFSATRKKSPGAEAGRQQELDRIEAEIPRLRRYARTLLINADRADDLVETCLEHTVDRLGRLPPGADIRCWLFALLRSVYRAARTGEPDSASTEPCPDGRSPRNPGDRGETAISEAFFDLDETQRETLLLLVMEQMSEHDAAALTDVSVATLRSRFARARETLENGLAAHQARLADDG